MRVILPSRSPHAGSYATAATLKLRSGVEAACETDIVVNATTTRATRENGSIKCLLVIEAPSGSPARLRSHRKRFLWYVKKAIVENQVIAPKRLIFRQGRQLLLANNKTDAAGATTNGIIAESCADRGDYDFDEFFRQPGRGHRALSRAAIFLWLLTKPRLRPICLLARCLASLRTSPPNLPRATA